MNDPSQSKASTHSGHRIDSDSDTATEALRELPRLLAELSEFVLYYTSARLALIRAQIRSAVFTTVGLLAIALAGLAAIATSAVLLLIGIAQAIARLAGGREWVGNIAVGIAVFVLLLAMVFVSIRRLRRFSFEQTKSQFDRHAIHHRSRFSKSDARSGHSDPEQSEPATTSVRE